MEIYVVQPNDTMYTIAAKFNVSASRLILDNGIENPNKLVPGQTIVIVYPSQTYVVKPGDTLESIASINTISQMQLLRNNPFLADTPPTPGQTLTIRYNTTNSLRIGGYIYPYIDRNVLRKTLPNLTYTTIYNYRATATGDVITFYDDRELVKIIKEYGCIPLLMATTLSAQGEADDAAAYSLLSTPTYQQNFVDNLIAQATQKGYMGVNIVFNYINADNLTLYETIIMNLSNRLHPENLLLFATINPNTKYINNELSFEEIDYSVLEDSADGITFLQFIWGVNYGPPSPINSIAKLTPFIEYISKIMTTSKVSIGNTLISYDWKLPYVPGVSYANSLSLNSSLRLALDMGTTIQFDEVSQSPFYYYQIAYTEEHIVWTLDARSINALLTLIINNQLEGARFWNLMIYAAQLWLVINSQYEIIKLIPNKFDDPAFESFVFDINTLSF